MERLMQHRRTFLKSALIAGMGARLASSDRAFASAAISQNAICGLKRRDETILRLSSMGDGYKMSWGADDQQFLVLNDGTGWSDPATKFFKRSLWSMSGSPTNAAVHMVPGYPNTDRTMETEEAPHYHGHGLLAVDGRIYQFLSALDRAEDRPRHWNAAKLIYSDDGGNCWRNQNGHAPVTWDDWQDQSPESLVFFNEPDGCFSLLTILQMGQDYRANRDGYIYVYGPNGNVDGLMNELVMFRVPVDRILYRREYEFFAGRKANGAATWTRNILERKPVHVFPEGWVNYTNLFPGDIVVETWLPSIVFNEALNLYMMISSGTGCAPDGTEFAKPSYLGFWVSASPWGPWHQVHEELAWIPGGDPASRAYSPQISPKWIAPDGKSFWIIWTDLKGIRELSASVDETVETEPDGKDTEASVMAEATLMRSEMPGYSFNAQRVELHFA